MTRSTGDVATREQPQVLRNAAEGPGTVRPTRTPAIRPGLHIHFLGIGGIGVSGLAAICLEQRCIVSGCDVKINSLALRLQEKGTSISIGHHPSHISGFVDLVVYSSAVPEHHPELATARARGIPTITRGEMLAALAAERHLIAIAGTHGKTTTSAMVSQVLTEAGWDPTVAVGGMMLPAGINGRYGTGQYLVAETDESDGSFLRLSPHTAIVTNIDREHLNYYRSFDRLIAAFEQFVGQLSSAGTLICCQDDPVVRRTLTHRSMLTYGLRAGADVTAEQMVLTGHGSRFRALYRGTALGAVTLQVPGTHNILNALGVISLALALEIPLITVREALANFEGTVRRFQVSRLPSDIWFVEDYAHHPAEIQATLAADAITERHRLVVFQPHRFTRTQSLERELTTCFDRADGVIITDIYPAFESPIPGVSGKRLAELIKDHGHPCVRYVPKQDLSSYVSRVASPGDTIFFLGAGDIGQLCHDLAAQLHSSA